MKQKTKQKIIDQYKTHKEDTGSPEVQIALLTEEIKELLEHLNNHPKDVHSKKGLLKKVAERKKLLRYLKTNEKKRYKKLIKKLGLKK